MGRLQVLLLLALLLAGPVVAQDSPSPEDGPEGRAVLLFERDRLAAEAGARREAGDVPGSLEVLDRVLALEERIFGAGHWREGDARRAREDRECRAKLTPADRKRLEEAARLDAEVIRLFREGDPKTALQCAEGSLAIRREVLGENHPDYAASLNDLANQCETLGDYSRAEPLYEQALAIRRAVLGEGHPAYGVSLNNLAALYGALGEPVRAEPLYRDAVEVFCLALGEDHPTHATGLNNLGRLYRSMGRYARAEPLYRRALRIWGTVVGEMHPSYAAGLENLAVLFWTMGDGSRAVPHFERALQIRRETLGDGHWSVATCLVNLAGVCGARGETGRAKELYGEALEIRTSALGKGHPEVARVLNDLAFLHASTGGADRAEDLHRQALEILGGTLGDEHPDYARTLLGLAAVYRTRGDFSDAEPLIRRAIAIRKTALGEEHPDYAAGLAGLALLFEAMGEPARAEPVYRRGLAIQRRVLDATFAVQSERRQLRMSGRYRATLDAWLSVAFRTDVDPRDAYAPVLAWKGAVFARQVASRAARGDPEAAALFDRFVSVSSRLASLSLRIPPAGERETWRRKIAELSLRREDLERSLSLRSEEYREARRFAHLTPLELQGVLPAGVRLVDFLDFQATVFTEVEGRRVRGTVAHLAAFVVSPDGGIHSVDLGPSAPISATLDRWLEEIRNGGEGASGAALRRLVLDPLSAALEGVTTLLVSPDGALCRLPFEALPGTRPGTVLLDEFGVAVVPVPRLLPRMLAAAPAGEREESLLLLGDVDYGEAGAAAPPGGLAPFLPLPASRTEIATIRDSFDLRPGEGRVTVLRGGKATEAALRSELPAHRSVHLATHGFFAPPGLRSALTGFRPGEGAGRSLEGTGFHPGVLSGLALSGANRAEEPDGEDGILTATEVASLDLGRVDLAVLSACETGLGDMAGGEGVLGLQRAFQLAGARTTVTSLWRVPDDATQLLMVRFYENLWSRGLPRLEALREAKLSIRRGGGKRGLRVEGGATKGRPPVAWAGFVLGGDWR